ncbi:MAG: hypothetical protein H0T89_27240, partial [Deltaproteobacteria bacterium]|nr:hypothetical protein [Deltaproteobacteria bacterium]
ADASATAASTAGAGATATPATATTAPASSALATTLGPPMVTSHRVGVGAAISLSTDSDPVFGLRIPLHLAVVGSGTLRAVPTLAYSPQADDVDPYHELALYAVALAVEYVAPLGPKFVLAAGLGIGVDLLSDNYEEGLVKQGAGSARLSPTLRLGNGLDVGLHLQVTATSDAILGAVGIGVDYFVW